MCSGLLHYCWFSISDVFMENWLWQKITFRRIVGSELFRKLRITCISMKDSEFILVYRSILIRPTSFSNLKLEKLILNSVLTFQHHRTDAGFSPVTRNCCTLKRLLDLSVSVHSSSLQNSWRRIYDSKMAEKIFCCTYCSRNYPASPTKVNFFSWIISGQIWSIAPITEVGFSIQLFATSTELRSVYAVL